MTSFLTFTMLGLMPIALQVAGPAPSLPEQAAPQIELSQENEALLRCSAAFALISFGQENGNEAALNWPKIDPKGREFFVQSLAKLMDETGLSRDQVSRLASDKAQQLLDEGQLDAIMPGCLLMLEASGI